MRSDTWKTTRANPAARLSLRGTSGRCGRFNYRSGIFRLASHAYTIWNVSACPPEFAYRSGHIRFGGMMGPVGHSPVELIPPARLGPGAVPLMDAQPSLPQRANRSVTGSSPVQTVRSSRVPHAPDAHPGPPSRRPDEPMLGEPLKATVGGSIWMLQGGLGTPEYFVLPMIPPGSPLPSLQPHRGTARVQTPGSCLFAATANGRIRQRPRRSSRRQARGR